jgi:hypothetical protein
MKQFKTACLLTMLALSLAAFSQTTSITIGSLKYDGTFQSPGASIESLTEVVLNTTDLTVSPIVFGNVILHVKGGEETTLQSGFPTITTGPGCGVPGITDPCDLLFIGGSDYSLPTCGILSHGAFIQNCVAMELQMVSATGENFGIPLLNGEQFCAFGIYNIVLKAQPNETALDPHCMSDGFCQGVSIPIVLAAAPTSSCN